MDALARISFTSFQRAYSGHVLNVCAALVLTTLYTSKNRWPDDLARFQRRLQRDFVKIGDVEGTVTQLGTLSTRLETLRREELTIPNAGVISTMTTN